MINYSLVPKYISAMDIGIIPFKLGKVSQNALPIKLFEYMACQKPVISSRIPAVQYIFGGNVLYAQEVDEYVHIIKRLYDNEKLRNELGEKGREIVKKEYEWKKIVEKLEKILIEIHNKPHKD